MDTSLWVVRLALHLSSCLQSVWVSPGGGLRRPRARAVAKPRLAAGCKKDLGSYSARSKETGPGSRSRLAGVVDSGATEWYGCLNVYHDRGSTPLLLHFSNLRSGGGQKWRSGDQETSFLTRSRAGSMTFCTTCVPEVSIDHYRHMITGYMLYNHKTTYACVICKDATGSHTDHIQFLPTILRRAWRIPTVG